ncbi:hypothetical protein BH09ACT10_BH09ACT10_05060 [soil metagenome]
MTSMPEDGPPQAPQGAYRLFRISGIGVYARPSLLLMGLLLAYVFAPRFSYESETNGYLLGGVLAIALYISVLIHELAHFFVARAYRMRVHYITLHFMGGETVIEGESKRPVQEFLIAFAGPAASLLVAAVAGYVGSVATGDAAEIIINLAFINLIVAIVNILPGLPLDGGHALRGIVWGMTGDRDGATIIVAWLGRLIAAAVVVYALVDLLNTPRPHIINLAVMSLVAAFLWTGSSEALHHAQLRKKYARAPRVDAPSLQQRILHRETLPRLHGRRLARTGVTADPTMPALPADIEGPALLLALSITPSPHYRLVEPDGSLYGVLDASAVEAAYRKGAS